MASSKKFTSDVYGPGVVFEIEVKDHTQSPPATSSMEVMVEGRNIAIPFSGSDGRQQEGKMVFRADRGDGGQVIVTDDQRKEYYQMDKSFAKNMSKQLDGAKSMMEKAMANLTDEQRAAIAKAQKESGGSMPAIPGMMGAPEKPELVKTGEKASKQGYPCVRYDVMLNGRTMKELWVTDWSNVKGGAEARGAFLEMGEFFDEMMDSFGMPGMGDNPYDAMNFDEGFPVVTRSFGDDGELEDESFLRSVSERDLDPDAFEPPKGYRLRTMGPQ